VSEEKNKYSSKEITASQARNIIAIATNVRKKTEIIRENMHNAKDAGASDNVIKVDYPNENLNLVFWNNGKSFKTDDEIIAALFHVSETKKIDGIDIGSKGVGFKLNLDCEEIKITSYLNSTKIILTVENPILQLRKIANSNKNGYIQYNSQIEKIQFQDAVNKGVKLELFSVNVSDILEFAHEKLEEHIVFFTTIALNNFDKEKFRVYFKGLEFETDSLKKKSSEEIDLEHILLPYNNSHYGIIKNSIKSKDNYNVLERGELSIKINELVEKYNNDIMYFDSNGTGFEKCKSKFYEMKKVCEINNVKIDFFVLQSIDKEIKAELNPLLGRNDIFKIAQNEFMGIYLSKLGILVPTRMNFNTLAGGGSGQTQYFGVFNCDSISLKIDRNELGSSGINNMVEKIIRENIMSVIDNIVRNSKKGKDNKNQKQAMEKARIDNPSNKDEQLSQISDKTVKIDTKKELAKIAGVGIEKYDRTRKILKLDNEEVTERAIEVILKLKTMNVINPEGDKINIFDCGCEIDLHSMIKLTLHFEPKILGFRILYTNPQKGIDLFCLPLGIEINESNLYSHGFWVELKHLLKTEFNHNMMDLKMIICWEMVTI